LKICRASFGLIPCHRFPLESPKTLLRYSFRPRLKPPSDRLFASKIGPTTLFYDGTIDNVRSALLRSFCLGPVKLFLKHVILRMLYYAIRKNTVIRSKPVFPGCPLDVSELLGSGWEMRKVERFRSPENVTKFPNLRMEKILQCPEIIGYLQSGRMFFAQHLHPPS